MSETTNRSKDSTDGEEAPKDWSELECTEPKPDPEPIIRKAVSVAHHWNVLIQTCIWVTSCTLITGGHGIFACLTAVGADALVHSGEVCHDLRWCRLERPIGSAQLSWFWGWIGRFWRGDNAAGSESLTLWPLCSLLIRPLAASPHPTSSLSLTAAFSSSVYKSENNPPPPPFSPVHRSPPHTALLIWLRFLVPGWFPARQSRLWPAGCFGC